MLPRWGIVACWLPCVVACGGPSEPPLVAPAPPQAEPVVDAGDRAAQVADEITRALDAGLLSDVVSVRDGGALPHLPGLPPNVIRRVVVEHRGALQACYTVEAGKDPTLKGAVTVHWSIDASGKVTATSIVSSTLGNASVEACLLRQVGSWSFPSSDGRSEVTFPFTFGVR